MLGSSVLKSGSLLISEPFMLDPNFKRSVILLIDYEIDGEAFGLVLNHPSPFHLDELLSDYPDLKEPIYVGGPVEPTTLHFLHSKSSEIEESISIKNELSYGGDHHQLIELYQEGKISKTDVKFFLGYAGWSPGQLEQEIRENTWFVTNNYHAQIPLLHDAEDLWKECIIAMGPKFAHVAKFPENPFLN